jgi:hypothetical protein
VGLLFPAKGAQADSCDAEFAAFSAAINNLSWCIATAEETGSWCIGEQIAYIYAYQAVNRCWFAMEEPPQS